jgi:hypothetical protein
MRNSVCLSKDVVLQDLTLIVPSSCQVIGGVPGAVIGVGISVGAGSAYGAYAR